MLDLGCGIGQDALFFLKSGLQVVGLDFSMFSLQLAQRLFQKNDAEPLGLVQADISDGLCFADASFDILHANLSLHYFDDDKLTCILDDIHRILRGPGLLGIAVRSTEDPKCGVGQQVSERGFNQDGCLRFFFDADYLEQKLCLFHIKQLFSFKPDYFEGDLLVAIATKRD